MEPIQAPRATNAPRWAAGEQSCFGPNGPMATFASAWVATGVAVETLVSEYGEIEIEYVYST